jgi:hypothetical protein
MKRKIKVTPGSWIFVPLQKGKGVMGIITVFSPKGIAFGYFFGDLVRLEDCTSIPTYKPEDAIFVLMFSDMGLRDGSWTLLNLVSSEKDFDFTLPKFEQPAPIRENGSIVTYGSDLLQPLEIRNIFHRKSESTRLQGLVEVYLLKRF